MRMRASPRSYQPYSQRRQLKKDRKRLIFSIIGAGILIYLLFFILLPWLIGGLSIFNKLKPQSTAADVKPITSTLAPPVLNIPYEATNTSFIRVAGYALPDVSIEIYLDDKLATTTKTGSDGSFTTNDINLSLGSNDVTGKTVDNQGNKSLASKDIRLTYDNQKPNLTVDSPQDNQQTSDTKITVSGSVDSSNISVNVNGQRLIVSSDGKFSKDIQINPGDNNLTITASNNSGNSITISRKVTSTATPSPTPNP